MAAPAEPHLPVREDWLALGREEILEPGRPIIDPHHHLWDRPTGRYLFPELLADLDAGHDVRGTVHIQCRSMYRAWGPEETRPVGEVEFVNGIAAQAASGIYGPRYACAGIVGFADLTLGEEVAPVIEALERAGGGRLRGLRHPVVWHADPNLTATTAKAPPPGLMRDASFRSGVSMLRRYGLSLDIWAFHTQLGEVFELAREHPDTSIIVDHLGGPIGIGPYAGRRQEVFSSWRASLARLAQLPNVHLKLGGLGMRVGGFTFHEHALPPSSADLAKAWRPYIETGIELFGASRCMLESNFPVDKAMFSYAALWNAFKRLTMDCSEPEKHALFFGTAARVYRLPEALLFQPTSIQIRE